MTDEQLDEFLLSFDGAYRDDEFGKGEIAYKYHQADDDDKLFALVDKDTRPLRVSLRCDPLLVKTLRERYETVVSPKNLDRRYWNTILCSGQLTDIEIFDLARLSYRLVSEPSVTV